MHELIPVMLSILVFTVIICYLIYHMDDWRKPVPVLSLDEYICFRKDIYYKKTTFLGKKAIDIYATNYNKTKMRKFDLAVVDYNDPRKLKEAIEKAIDDENWRIEIDYVFPWST